MAEEKQDHLALRDHPSVTKMLAKHGNNTPDEEVVHFSDFVVKINRKGKEQTRVLLLTQKALYNLMPNDYSKCKRRVAIESMGAITLSDRSNEFVLHIPEEYDYRFSSQKKRQIAKMLVALHRPIATKMVEGTSSSPMLMRVVESEASDLKDVVISKEMARLQTREDILRRKQAMMEKLTDEDRKEEAAADDDAFEQMLDTGGSVKLDDFELLKVLGRGSFGKVMQVKKKSDGKVYAMKILKKRAIIARKQVDHTRAERRILEALQHPFLMTLRYAFQSREKLYFVLDYFQGGELFFHLKNKRRFSEEVARIYVAEIALALGHLHSQGVVYRDLKPENILLDDNGHVCLTDFGLSKDIAPGEEAHTFCGTPEYLAPEIVASLGHDKAVDWWSLGILLYELTVGIPPFYSQNVNEMYNKIQHGVLRFPPFLSDECKSLIVGLLNRDPKQRLGSDQDVKDVTSHPFFKVLDFDKLMKKEIEVAYKPKVKSQTDTSNFDPTFTQERVVDSVGEDSAVSATLKDNASAFDDFTFAEKGGHLQG